MSEIEEIEELKTPLTKKKTSKKNNDVVNEELPMIPPPPKEKIPRSEKQRKQFELAIVKRKENLDKRIIDKKIEASKLLLEKGIIVNPKKLYNAPKHADDDIIKKEEVIEKKPRTFIIKDESSDED